MDGRESGDGWDLLRPGRACRRVDGSSDDVCPCLCGRGGKRWDDHRDSEGWSGATPRGWGDGNEYVNREKICDDDGCEWFVCDGDSAERTLRREGGAGGFRD